MRTDAAGRLRPGTEDAATPARPPDGRARSPTPPPDPASTRPAKGGTYISTPATAIDFPIPRTCPIHEELTGIFRKTAGLADVLRDALAPIARKVRLAFIFGSVAQGKERASSDVDVLVVGSASFRAVVEALSRVRDRLRREVNPVVMTAAAFEAKLASRDRFVARVAREPKLFLLGTPVTLQNLHKIGQLKEHPPDTAEIQRLLAAVALLASWLPARRARRVEPSLVLRGE